MVNYTGKNTDKCVCCGATVPEGAMVCKRCELDSAGAKPRDRKDPKQRKCLFGNRRKNKQEKNNPAE